MKTKNLSIFLSLVIFISCSGNNKKAEIKKINSENTIQTIAVFKSAENIHENDWKLIFRKLDDCQYILFYTDIKTLNSYKDNLVSFSENTSLANPDFVNLRYNINYIEETVPDPLTGENIVINRLIDINRIQSDRYTVAGFDNDTVVDDFLIDLKKRVRNDSVLEISEMIYYPLTVINNHKRLKITDQKLFVKDYNRIFNKKIKSIVLSQQIADVKASSDGLIFGKGEILINPVDGKISITTIKIY